MSDSTTYYAKNGNKMRRQNALELISYMVCGHGSALKQAWKFFDTLPVNLGPFPLHVGGPVTAWKAKMQKSDTPCSFCGLFLEPSL